MELSPVRTVVPWPRAETAVIKRSVVPELPTSITLSGVCGSPSIPLINNLSPSFSMYAPNISQAFIVDWVSAEIKGLWIMDSFERAATVIAL